MAGLSDQIPFDYFLDPLGEDLEAVGSDGTRTPIRAILTFRDEVSTMGQQYQYLQLEVDSSVIWEKGQAISARGKIWRVSQRLDSTYTGSTKYTCGNDY